jgi:hypothetical protein
MCVCVQRGQGEEEEGAGGEEEERSQGRRQAPGPGLQGQGLRWPCHEAHPQLCPRQGRCSVNSFLGSKKRFLRSSSSLIHCGCCETSLPPLTVASFNSSCPTCDVASVFDSAKFLSLPATLAFFHLFIYDTRYMYLKTQEVPIIQVGTSRVFSCMRSNWVEIASAISLQHSLPCHVVD